MQDFISNVWFQLAFAILLLVAGWRMNVTGANWLLLVAWVIIASCVFRSPWLSGYDPIPRVLITMGVITPICLIVYYSLWTHSE